MDPQECLQGARTTLLATVSPDSNMAEDTYSTIRVAQAGVGGGWVGGASNPAPEAPGCVPGKKRSAPDRAAGRLPSRVLAVGSGA